MIVCTKCGFRNEANTEFCGSCGSFLEWTGAKVDQAAALAKEASELQARLVESLAVGERLTGREIAAILKVTPGRVSQIARKAGTQATSHPDRRGHSAAQSA